MSNPDTNTDRGVVFAGKLWLNTLDNTRKTFARVLRAYAAGRLKEKEYRSLIYGLSQYTAVWKAQIDYQVLRELDERLRSIENEA